MKYEENIDGVKGLVRVPIDAPSYPGMLMFYVPDINPSLHDLSYKHLVPEEVRNKYTPHSILIEKLIPNGDHYFIKVIFE